MERPDVSPTATTVKQPLQLAHVYDMLNRICCVQAAIIQILLANGLFTMPSPPLQPVAYPPQVEEDQPKLPCIVFLKTHYDQGGVNRKEYDVLYRMIEMASAIGSEVHVVFQSKIPRAGSVANMLRFADCILQGAEAFCKNMKTAMDKGASAAEQLPDLAKLAVEGYHDKLSQWQAKLSTLHEPTGNDVRLFKLIFVHYDEAAYERLVALHCRKRKYGLDHVVERARLAHCALKQLYNYAEEADKVVLALDAEFERAQQQLLANIEANFRATVDSRELASETVHDQQLLTAAVYKPSIDTTSKPHSFLSKSFGIPEEEVARRGHARAATVSEADYTAAASSASLVQPKPTHPHSAGPVGMRRKAINVPRIFTGSFSQLETDLRKLDLDKIQTPEAGIGVGAVEDVKVRDFGVTPLISPCSTPSPATPLQRREALMSRDIEFQDRVINGEVITSRRPSTKVRAQTVDDTNNGLESWLKQASSEPHSPMAPDSAVRRGNLRHRENTL